MRPQPLLSFLYCFKIHTAEIIKTSQDESKSSLTINRASIQTTQSYEYFNKTMWYLFELNT